MMRLRLAQVRAASRGAVAAMAALPASVLGPAPAWAGAAFPLSPQRPVATYSIVARDPATGEMGVAVQSHWFGVGSVVSWGEPGVGVVATQSFADPGYGYRGLNLMKDGVSAPEALRALLAVDEASAVRQVAFLDAQGRVAAHTGSRCIDFASHYVGDQFSVQANIMVNEKVVPAMVDAYEASVGPLTHRLLAALDGAQAAGGDLRGMQSAALLVVSGERTDKPWEGRRVDLRVEDHPEPVKELRRLVGVQEAFAAMNRGDQALERADHEEALAQYRLASRLLPEHLEVIYWQAVTLATVGEVEEALPLFRRVFAEDADYVELTRRLQKPEIIPPTEEGNALVERILREAR